MKHAVFYGAIVVGLLFGATEVEAQYHNKDGQGGAAVLNQQAVDNIRAQQGAQIGRGVKGIEGDRVGFQAAAHYLPAWANDPSLEGAIRLGEMGDRQSYVMGQTVHHSNGSYTETTREEKMTRDITDIQQTTYSARGVKMAVRTIKHDAQGRPSEVVIRDATNKFKYRGVLVYDPLSRRLKEEQLYDANNRLLRRNIQEYSAQGHRMPFKTVDYVKDLPMDLQLVVVKEDKKAEQDERRGLFERKKQPEPELVSDGGVTTGPAPVEKKKGLLNKLFNWK